MDYAQARYFASTQGRFTSPDPLLASGRSIRPQTWNRYTYALNNPLRFTDPSGLSPTANITPKYQSDDHVEQQRQQQQVELTQAEFNEAWMRRYVERAAQGYIDDTADMTMSMFTVSISEPGQDETVYYPFVISNASQLIDQVIAGTNTGYHDANSVAQCALLPLMWENEQDSIIGKIFRDSSDRTTPNWHQGVKVSYGMNLARGTVLASGWENGKYLSKQRGNHTVVFDKWDTVGGRTGMYVIEQLADPHGVPRRSFKAFWDSGYFKDAGAFHVVNLNFKVPVSGIP